MSDTQAFLDAFAESVLTDEQRQNVILNFLAVRDQRGNIGATVEEIKQVMNWVLRASMEGLCAELVIDGRIGIDIRDDAICFTPLEVQS